MQRVPLLGNLVSSLLLKPNHDTINSTVNLFPANGVLCLSGSSNGSLVHEILQLSTREARRTTSNGFQVDIGLKGLSTCVDAQDTGMALEIRKINSDLTIETSRTQQSLVKNINTVGSSDCDNSRISIETIHLYQKYHEHVMHQHQRTSQRIPNQKY